MSYSNMFQKHQHLTADRQTMDFKHQTCPQVREQFTFQLKKFTSEQQRECDKEEEAGDIRSAMRGLCLLLWRPAKQVQGVLPVPGEQLPLEGLEMFPVPLVLLLTPERPRASSLQAPMDGEDRRQHPELVPDQEHLIYLRDKMAHCIYKNSSVQHDDDV